MSYIQKSLGDGERIVGKARFHWLYDAKAWLALLAPIAILIAILVYGGDANRDAYVIGGLMLIVIGAAVWAT